MKDGFFGDLFDFDGDGELDLYEETLDLLVFAEMISDDEKITPDPVFDFDDLDLDI